MPDPTLRLYALIRTDLGMSPGKVVSQAGHAFLGAAIRCQETNPSALTEYHSEFPQSPGTKVCLEASSLHAIQRAQEEAEAAGLPTFLVVDSGCQNFFNGQPTITALGIGPVKKEHSQQILKRFQLLK